MRPGTMEPQGRMESPTLSRRQWLVRPAQGHLEIESVGRSALLHNGVNQERCRATEGDVVSVEGVVSFFVERRPARLPALAETPFPFGAPDAYGIIGESLPAWELRRRLSALRHETCHVLLLGESGAGKELAARSLHGPPNARRPFVSRNAATIPASLIEAELFGNAPNYPNGGMPARQGLIGSADGGDLFLDEIAELGEAQQASLLRVLDAGEYQRLGEDRQRVSRLRLIGATNRSPERLKPDFLARFAERIWVPSLVDRAADVPLLAKHLVQNFRPQDPPGFSQALLEALVRHEYTLHARELERLVRNACRAAPGPLLDLSEELRSELKLRGLPQEFDAQTVQAALSQARNVEEAARQLGLPNRYALYRVMRRLGLPTRHNG